MADETQKSQSAKSQLTTDQLAFPPYDDITFTVRYP